MIILLFSLDPRPVKSSLPCLRHHTLRSPMATEEQPLPQNRSILPDYTQLIMEAIEALDDSNGSNKRSISRQIESTHPDLPAAHTTLLAYHLNGLKQAGQLIMVKNNYMRPDPNAPPKRGRGRPPKPKPLAEPGVPLPSPRPRGRPPKVKDPIAPMLPAKRSDTSGRPRGRPPKKSKTAAEAPTASPQEVGVKRRGRPRKVALPI